MRGRATCFQLTIEEEKKKRRGMKVARGKAEKEGRKVDSTGANGSRRPPFGTFASRSIELDDAATDRANASRRRMWVEFGARWGEGGGRCVFESNNRGEQIATGVQRGAFDIYNVDNTRPRCASNFFGYPILT